MRDKIILSFVFMCCFISAQVTVVDKPAPGFEQRIRDFVSNIRIIDTHEHLATEEERLAMQGIDFTLLFRHYAKEDIISASNQKGLVEIIFGGNFPLADRWALFEPYYKSIRTTGYGRVPLIVARDIYGIPDINENTFQELSKKVQEATKPGLYRHILKDMAKIELSIQDRGHQKLDPEFYRHVERFDNFIAISSGDQMRNLCAQHDVEAKSLESLCDVLRKAFSAGLEYGMIGVKSGLAYNRIIKYDNTPEETAAAICADMLAGKPLAADQIKAFQDYMMHSVLNLADEFDMPVQIHTGLQAGNGNTITNSNPTHLANLFMEYPNVNFCLFHGAYPYGGELATLAKNFPNVYIDMCWMYIISPSYSKRYLHEWLETVPANKIMAFGGDYSVVECIYGHVVMARQIVSDVLIDKVASQYMTEDEARHVAKRLLRENALEVFKLEGRSRGIEHIAVLNRPGPLKEWWDIHKTTEGFIRQWQVIGPFETGEGLGQVYPPEKEIRFEKTYDGVGGKVGWQTVETSESGYLNFISVFNKTQKYLATGFVGHVYAYSEITSPENRDITLTLGSNDGAKIWLKERVIYNKSLGRNAVADQEFLKVRLKKGKNPLLVKVENLGANWGLYVRVVDPVGE